MLNLNNVIQSEIKAEDYFKAMKEFASGSNAEIDFWTYCGEEPEQNIGDKFDFPHYPFKLKGLDGMYYITKVEDGTFSVFVRD